jgi:PleD family two-component response regulator
LRTKRAELGDCYDFSMSSGAMVANHVQLGDIDEVLARADQKMYAAKRARRRVQRPAKAPQRGS